MHNWQKKQETAIVVTPKWKNKKTSDQKFDLSVEERLEEACGLAEAIWLEVVKTMTPTVTKILPSTLLGKGACEDVFHAVQEHNPDVVIVDHALSPVQQRNLEKSFHAKVIDRTGLILEIFGDRAQTKEGKIQVELAALEYQRSRLVRSWTHLERQRGGAGFMGGPGETQIEIDRRLIGERITALKKQLEKVKKTRDLGRQGRERVPFPIVALVGYTNAGKSTLFNTLTGADVFAKDLLFATLDPTMRKLELSAHQSIVLADTVGFISDLPTHLVAAFRSTLEQVEYADIILHVRDISTDYHEAQKDDVVQIMKDLGIDYEEDDRIIEVWNKTDLLDNDEQLEILRKAKFDSRIIPVSAVEGKGLEYLKQVISQKLEKDILFQSLVLKGEGSGKTLAWLHQNAVILGQDYRGNDITVELKIEQGAWGKFQSLFKDGKDYERSEVLLST